MKKKTLNGQLTPGDLVKFSSIGLVFVLDVVELDEEADVDFNIKIYYTLLDTFVIRSFKAHKDKIVSYSAESWVFTP